MSKERKVVFVNIDEIYGLPEPHSQYYLQVGIHPKGEESKGKIVGSDPPKSNSTWSLIYQSDTDQFVFIKLFMNTTVYAKLLLPLKWFEVNSKVRETFPMRVSDANAVQNQVKIMITVLIHRSENGEGPFTANDGKLLVQPQWDPTIKETHNSNTDEVNHENNDSAKSETSPVQTSNLPNNTEPKIQSEHPVKNESPAPQIQNQQASNQQTAQPDSSNPVYANQQIPLQAVNPPIAYPVLQPQYVFLPTTNGQFMPMLLLPATKDSPALLTPVYPQPQ